MTIEETLAGPLRARTEVVSAFADLWPNIILGGVQQYAHWNDHVFAIAGDPITVLREVDPNGIARNTVIGRVGRPGGDTGTIVSTDGTKAVVSLGAEEVDARYAPGTVYNPGDVVALDWKGGTVTVLFKVTSYIKPPPPPAPTAPPPPSANTGQLKPRATDSATYVAGLGWNNWAGGRQNVYQGSQGGYTTYGSWFYNGATKQLAGATIERVRIRIPERLNGVGAYNNPITLHVYVHTSNNRPGGDVARVLGPYNLTIPAGFQGGLFNLPIAAGEQLKGGGGISIAGEPYAGFVGKAQDPTSGQLFFDWSR